MNKSNMFVTYINQTKSQSFTTSANKVSTAMWTCTHTGWYFLRGSVIQSSSATVNFMSLELKQNSQTLGDVGGMVSSNSWLANKTVNTTICYLNKNDIIYNVSTVNASDASSWTATTALFAVCIMAA